MSNHNDISLAQHHNIGIFATIHMTTAPTKTDIFRIDTRTTSNSEIESSVVYTSRNDRRQASIDLDDEEETYYLVKG